MNTNVATLPRIILGALTLVAFSAPGLSAQALTLTEAETAMAAAEAESRTNGWNLTILISDAEGTPVMLKRMDGASARTFEIATRKVATALGSGMDTGAYGRALQAGTVDEVPNGVTFEGGYPIRRGGDIIGAMSASGASGADDAQAVRAGMAAIGLAPM